MERRKEARKVGRFKRPREKKGGRIDSRSEGYVCIFSLAAKFQSGINGEDERGLWPTA